MTRVYFGCVIHRNTGHPDRLRWYAFTAFRQVSADTLAGLRRLIRADMETSTDRKRRETRTARQDARRRLRVEGAHD